MEEEVKNKNKTHPRKTLKKKKEETKKVEEKKVEEVKTVEEKKERKIEPKDKANPPCEFRNIVVILLVASLLGAFIGSYVTYKWYDDKLDEEKGNKTELEIVYDDIKSNYYGDLNLDKLSSDSLKGMVEGLNDRYGQFMDKETTLSYNEDLNGFFTGIGVEVSSEGEEYQTIVTVFEDSPAAKSGLKVGDHMVSMDGIAYTKDQIPEMTYAIKSSKIGDKKTFGILRDGEMLTLEITLEKITTTSVYSSVIEEDGKTIGRLDVTNFSANTYKQFQDEYKKLKEQGISAIIIDLRNNQGGYLSGATDIASMFLDKGDVIYQQKDNKKTTKVTNKKEKEIDLPVVLIVNQCSASSAEMLASTLNENLGAEVIGETTYGKGSIQKYMVLNGGSSIKYTVGEILTSKGKTIEQVGVVPTYQVEWTEESDSQLQKAIEVLLAK